MALARGLAHLGPCPEDTVHRLPPRSGQSRPQVFALRLLHGMTGLADGRRTFLELTMRLTDLEPRWLLRHGQRVGLVFKSPTKPQWFQSCVFAPTPHEVQRELFNAVVGHLCEKPEYGYTKVQGCNEACGWTVAGGAGNATFETLTITPSLDGSAGGLWHGFITNGEIVGGI